MVEINKRHHGASARTVRRIFVVHINLVVGHDETTDSLFPLTSELSKCRIANVAESVSANSAEAKPFDTPVSLLMTSLTPMTWPALLQRCSISASVTSRWLSNASGRGRRNFTHHRECCR